MQIWCRCLLYVETVTSSRKYRLINAILFGSELPHRTRIFYGPYTNGRDNRLQSFTVVRAHVLQGILIKVDSFEVKP